MAAPQQQGWSRRRTFFIVLVIILQLAFIMLYRTMYVTADRPNVDVIDFEEPPSVTPDANVRQPVEEQVGEKQMVEEPHAMATTTATATATATATTTATATVTTTTVVTMTTTTTTATATATPEPEPEPEPVDPPKHERAWVKMTMPLLYPTADNPTPHKSKPLCPDTRSHPGEWSTREYNLEPSNLSLMRNISYWEPYQCQYHPFTRTELGKCMLDRHIIVAGDSLIRNVLTTMLRHLNESFDWGDALMQRDQREIFHLMNYETGDFMGYGAFHFLWDPSVWFFTPKWTENGGANVSWIRPKGSTVEPVVKGNFIGDQRAGALVPVQVEQPDDTTVVPEFEFEQYPIFDTVILSMGIWDMGFYNVGVNPFHMRLLAALHDTLVNLHFPTTPPDFPKPTVYFNDLPRLHADLCHIDICSNCNTDVRQRWFREAQRGARVCLPHYYGLKDRIEVLDYLDMTNSEFARTQTFDGTHYDHDVNIMEMHVLLNGMCKEWLRDKSGLYEERFGTVEVELDALEKPGLDPCEEVEETNETAVLGRCKKVG